MHGRPPLYICHLQPRPGNQQPVGDRSVVQHGCQMQWCAVAPGRCIDGFLIPLCLSQQQLHNFIVARLCRDVQAATSQHIPGPAVGLRVQQRHHNPHVLSGHGHVQRRVSAIVDARYIDAILNHGRYQVRITPVRCKNELPVHVLPTPNLRIR